VTHYLIINPSRYMPVIPAVQEMEVEDSDPRVARIKMLDPM
jgi:hypothetical protein